MKKVLFLLMFVCANIVAMAQTEYGLKVKQKAESGDAKEMYFLAQCYEFGNNGFEKDNAQAVSWYKKSAESGYTQSAKKLATSYKLGKLGLAKDEGEYVNWVKKASELGDNASTADLASFYLEGKYGVKKNEKEGVKLAEKAADNGEYEAMYTLGAYYKGKGDNDEAIAWYKKCCDKSYERRGRTHSGAEKDLKALGVTYDPAGSSSNKTATASAKTVAVGDEIDIYYRSGQLWKAGTVVKKGSDYYVKVGKDELKLTPCNEKQYSSLFDMDITYQYTLKMYDIDMFIKDKIKGAPTAKGSSSSSSSSASSDDDNCAVKDGKVVLYDRRGEEFMTCLLIKKNGKYTVKVDNNLYNIKAESRRFNGVTYNYMVLLGDGEYFIKGEIPGFASGASSSSKSKSKTTTTTKKTTKSSDESSVSKAAKKVGNKVKGLKKKLKF